MIPKITRSAGLATKLSRAAYSRVSLAGMAVISVAICLLLQMAPAFAQTTWTQCAVEGATCTLPAGTQKWVRYGEPFNNKWTPTSTRTGSFLCANSTFTDPSPGTGKRCEYMDVGTPPPPVVNDPVLPPLATGEAYVVSWVKPTTNTDGTPIGTITKTEIQASTTADFAKYYVWTANDPNATNVSVVNGPTGTVYWRARVTTAAGTSDYSATAVTERQWVSQTKPTCWPKPFGSGTWLKTGQNADGFALYWQCVVNGQYVHAGMLGTWASLDPDWSTQLATAMSQTDGFSKLWDAKVTGPSQASKYATVRPLYDALKAANPLPVITPPTYKVALYGTASTRPAYTIVNGSRTSTLAGRVTVGAACDCAAFKAGASPNLYCAVTGNENVATATVGDKLPVSTAVCSAAP